MTGGWCTQGVDDLTQPTSDKWPGSLIVMGFSVLVESSVVGPLLHF